MSEPMPPNPDRRRFPATVTPLLIMETNAIFAQRTSVEQVEEGTDLAPKFDDKGLLCAVVVDHASRAVLMVAFMDAEALAATRATGLAHFHSRSRGKLWQKGESSGHVLEVAEIPKLGTGKTDLKALRDLASPGA